MRFFDELAARLFSTTERALTLQQLRRLNDHLLRDIGLQRADLDAGRLAFRQEEAPLRRRPSSSVPDAARPSLQGCG